MGTGGTWNRDGTILFSNLAGPSPIYRISSDGGEASPTTRRQPPEFGQLPQFLPDGRHFLFYSPGPTSTAVFVGDLDGSESRRLLEADTAATYVPSGHLVFGREGTLFAQAFDTARLALSGNPFRVAAQVAASGWSPALSASAIGTLVYRVGSGVHRSTNPSLGRRPLIWFDRSGKEVGKVGASDSGARPSLAPDGRQVAVFRSADQDLLTSG